MTHITRSRLSFAVVLLLAIVAISIYLAGHSSSRAQTYKDPAAAPTPKVENFNFLIAAPYWSVENGFVSTIEMKNYHVEEPLTITPILYPRNGPEIILTPITLNPSETRLLNINDVLATYGKQFTVGAAEIRYSQLTEGVFGANLTVLNSSKSLIYNFQFRFPEMTARLEGLWWFYDKQTDGFVAVQNTSEKNVTVVPTLYVHEQPHQLQLIELGPHKTQLIELRRELNRLKEDEIAGGINLQASESGAIIAGGGLVNPEIGFSAPLRMDDPDMQGMRAKHLGQTIHALAVMIGADDPMMSMGLPASARMNPIINLRNVSGHTIQVSPVFRYQAGNLTKTLALKAIQLNSQQVQRIDLLPYQRSGQIPKQVSSGSVELSYSGKSGSLIASVTSVDQTGSYVFDSKTDNKLAAGFHGEYWSTEGDNDTSITIKNITGKPATAWVSLQYDAGRGQYDLPALVLQPGESHMIDLKMIQMEAMAGASGELLPQTARYGGFKLVEEPGGRHFLVDAVVFNPKTATCGVCGFGCLYPTSINMPGGTYIVALADSGDIIAVNAHMCDGTNQTGWACVSTFSSDNTGIATNNPACQSHGTGVSVGGTTFRTVAADVPGPHCGDQTLYSSRPVTVNPSVTSVSPNKALIGTSNNITVTGRGFDSSTTLSISGGTISSLNVSNSTTITAAYLIDDNATGGDHRVTVTVNGQPTTDNVNFYVQIPTTLQIVSVTTLSTGTSGDFGCTPSQDYGIKVAVQYEVLDQHSPGQPIATDKMEPQEEVTSEIINGSPPFDPAPSWTDIGASRISYTSQFTDVNGRFYDAPLGICGTAAFTGSFSQQIRILASNQNPYVVRSHSFTLSSSASGAGSISNGTGGDIQKSRP